MEGVAVIEEGIGGGKGRKGKIREGWEVREVEGG